MSDAYGTFLKRVREINITHSVAELLGWDQETMMPKAAASFRGDQMAMLAGLAHERLVSDEFARALESAERAGAPDAAAQANLREMRRHYDRAVRVPKTLVEEIAKAVSVSKPAWAAAREENAFAKFAPHMERVLDLKRQMADAIGWTTEPYDALLDEYEPGAKSADVQRVFDAVRAEIVPLVKAIASAPRKPKLEVLKAHVPAEQQHALCRRLAETVGFDFSAGRLDVSAHPFCSGTTPADVRLTTRFDENFLPKALFGTLHEAGHGMYEQGLLGEHAFTPMGFAVSLGIHESQSRMWENMVGRSLALWRHCMPLVQAGAPALRSVSVEDWHFAVNHVAPSLIRVEADEVTYGLHIILRFDLERQLVSGKLAVKDVPAAWNTGMQSVLGITPPSDAKGCLQDIHWASGLFGYFPTYALGNLYAAQFYRAAEQALGNLEGRFEKGDYGSLLAWLRENIHRHGQQYRATELVKRVTGAELSHRPFVDYLNGKFKSLYGL